MKMAGVQRSPRENFALRDIACCLIATAMAMPKCSYCLVKLRGPLVRDWAEQTSRVMSITSVNNVPFTVSTFTERLPDSESKDIA